MTYISRFSRAAAVAGLALALSPTTGWAKTVLHVSSIPIIDTAPLQAAIKQGYFAAEDLEVDTSPTAGGAIGIPALVAGQVQLTVSNTVSIAIAADKGLGLKIVSAGSDTGDKPPDLAGLVAAPGSKIKSGRDLEGKRLAVNTRQNIIWLYANAWVEKTGGDPAKVTYTEIPFPQMIDAVKSGRVAAAFAIEPFMSAALASHTVEFVGWPYNSVQQNIPISGYAATESYIKAHPDTIARFVRAYDKGVDWVNNHINSPEFAALISSYTKLPPDRVKAFHLPPFRKSMEASRLDPVLALMRKFHMIGDKTTAATLLYKTALSGGK
jgi:NitT/TauT family transport system substrate-binding protein